MLGNYWYIYFIFESQVKILIFQGFFTHDVAPKEPVCNYFSIEIFLSFDNMLLARPDEFSHIFVDNISADVSSDLP